MLPLRLIYDRVDCARVFPHKQNYQSLPKFRRPSSQLYQNQRCLHVQECFVFTWRIELPSLLLVHLTPDACVASAGMGKTSPASPGIQRHPRGTRVPKGDILHV